MSRSIFTADILDEAAFRRALALEDGMVLKSFTFPVIISAGALVRGRIKREMQAACWREGFELEIREAKGWLESELLFRITVPGEGVMEARELIIGWMEYLNGLRKG